VGTKTCVSINATVASIESLRSQGSGQQSPDGFVTGLLADLRHYCDAHELDFAALDHRAYQHYCLEQYEADPQPREGAWQRPPVYLSIPLQAWEDVSTARDRSVLAAQVVIEGVPHSLLAVLMEEADRVRNEPPASRAAAGEALLPKQPFKTVRIFGRNYCLGMTSWLF
jgi:hypothetical protein